MQDIKALSHEQLQELFETLGQPKFRVKQLEKRLYGLGATSFDDIYEFPKPLREKLASEYTLSAPTIVASRESADGSRVFLLELADGNRIETVGIPSGDRLTVCFSTQVGCPMKCAFCATGLQGFTRNLNCGEMVDQIRIVADSFEKRVSNVVAMGQGEPFLNYNAVLSALRYMNSADGLNIGARKITVSTCGIIRGIRRFAEEPEQFTLAVSLHSALQGKRNDLMPGVIHESLDNLRLALGDYVRKTNRRPTLEYALIAGKNDSPAALDALLEFCEGLHCHVNLIPLNDIPGSPYTKSPAERFDAFSEALQRHGVETTVRDSRGSDVDGACGQLYSEEQRKK